MARRKKASFNVGDLVIISWRDAITDSAWLARDEIEELKPIVHSIGWVQRIWPESIAIGADIGAKDTESNRRVEVPLGMVQRVQVLYRGKRKKMSH